MRKLLLVCLFMAIAAVSYAQSQNKDVLYNNPGYFESPGFVALGGTMLYGNSDTHRDTEVRPFALGMWNVIQSEYGNLGLSLGFIPITPYKYYNEDDVSFKMSTQQYSYELGLNYVTGSKWLNVFFGAGYNANYVTTQLRNFTNPQTGADSNYQKNYYQWVYGWQYYFGIEYILTKSGNWGIYFLFRGEETKRAKYHIDETINFDDGSSVHYTDDLNMDLNNKSYTLGIIYHF